MIIDTHTHGSHMIPRWLDTVGRVALPSMPATVSFGELDHAVVATAVGDGLLTSWRWPGSQWTVVHRQIVELRAEARKAAARIVVDTDGLHEAGGTAVILGIEGADVVGTDPGRLHDLFDMGVRVLGLVHYADNGLGTITMSTSGRSGSAAVRSGRRRPGLTPLGAEIVMESNRLGMLIDLAHADKATTMAVCERTTAPVLSSHTGAAALQDFARYIGDDEARAIAATGGAIGLWPFGMGSRGLADIEDFIRHANHFGEVVGPEHLAIGTDMNGVPSYMNGFANATEFGVLAGALRSAGFDQDETAGIMGGNAARVLAAAWDHANTVERQGL